jgi:glycosyltransferase involved in cell wall biosynthesis
MFHKIRPIPKDDLGVNVIGFVRGEFGLGQGAIMTIKALESAGIKVNAINFNRRTEQRSIDKSITKISKTPQYPINIIQIQPDHLNRFLRKHRKLLKNRYNIAFWVWELPQFPKKWNSYFSFFDEVWTQSSFCAQSMSLVSPIPISVFTCPVMPNSSHITRQDLKLPEDKFIFLTIFDFCSSIIRKNIMGVIEAFEKVFKDDLSTILIIKTIAGDNHPLARKQLLDRIANTANILTVDTTLGRDEYNGLIKSCDVLVSLHRGEGFGLTMFEAMSVGKPVIATNFSGNTDFMNDKNSFLVPYKMVEVANVNSNYTKGYSWAEPDIDKAAELMKTVRSDYNRAKEIANKAQLELNTNYSLEKVGERMKTRLELIYQQFDYKNLRHKNLHYTKFILKRKTPNFLKKYFNIES